MKNLILFIGFVVLCGCEELPFTDEDVQGITVKSETANQETANQETKKETNNFQEKNKTSSYEKNQREISINIEEREIIDETELKNEQPQIEEEVEKSIEREIKVFVTDNSLKDNGEISDFDETKEKVTEWKISRTEREEQIPENPLPEEEPFLEEEITVISEDLKLKKDTVIQNRKVVLDMAVIKTFEYDLFIIAEEFVSNHSVIQNFSKSRKAKKSNHGRNGGNILIEAETAQGELQLILNGEKAGRVPIRLLSKKERKRFKGQNGENGYNAVYQTFCKDIHLSIPIPVLLPLTSLSIPVDQECWEECAAFPTPGEDGGDGREGFAGFDGKNGGDSGSFHLKAYQLEDFRLTDIQNSPGLGSKGGKGSKGGDGGYRGLNGIDKKDLCHDDLAKAKKGKKGERGPHGKDGKKGKKGTICLERITEKNKSFISDEQNAEEERIICY